YPLTLQYPSYLFTITHRSNFFIKFTELFIFLKFFVNWLNSLLEWFFVHIIKLFIILFLSLFFFFINLFFPYFFLVFCSIHSRFMICLYFYNCYIFDLNSTH